MEPRGRAEANRLTLWHSVFGESGARRISSLVEETQSRSVLGVFAHPDDEILVAAVLTDAVNRGCAVHTVTATKGTRGVPRHFAGDRAELARLREAELRRFGDAIGVLGQEVWDFPDGELYEANAEALLESVSDAIRRTCPDLVVTFDSMAGFTGHPDHRRIGEVAMQASRQACASMSKPRHVARVVFPERVAALLPNRELRQLLRRQPRADVAVEGNRHMTLLGMEIHRTQQQFFPPQWARSLLCRIFTREYFAMVRLAADGDLPR